MHDKNVMYNLDIVDGSRCKAWLQCNTRRWTHLPEGCNIKGYLLFMFGWYTMYVQVCSKKLNIVCTLVNTQPQENHGKTLVIGTCSTQPGTKLFTDTNCFTGRRWCRCVSQWPRTKQQQQFNNTDCMLPPTKDGWPITMLMCAKGMLTKIKKI